MSDHVALSSLKERVKILPEVQRECYHLIGPKQDWIREAELREDMPRPQGKGLRESEVLLEGGQGRQRVWR